MTPTLLDVLGLLRSLEQSFPPGIGAHHSLTRCRYGDDEDGWVEQLLLTIEAPGPARHKYLIEPKDLMRTTEEVFQEVFKLETARRFAEENPNICISPKAGRQLVCEGLE